MGYGSHTLRALALIAFAAITSTAHASPPDVFGYGPRTQGMGMTGTAFATNYEATWANPAGLAAERRLGFTFGLQGGSFELDIDGEQWNLDGYQGTTLGLYIPVPFGGPLEDVFVLAAGFYTPSATVLRTDIIFPERSNFLLLARTQSVHIQLGLGINLDRLVPGLRLGVGVAALAAIGGRLRVAVDAAGTFVSETETQLLASFHPLVGFQLDLGDFTIGAVYREELRSDVALDINVEGLPVDVPVLTITAVPQFDPHNVAAEIAWRRNAWMVALQAHYRRWSTYPGVVGRTSSNSELPPAPGFRDTLTPRLGVEWTGHHRRTTLQLRAGYAFEPTPTRPARMAATRDADGNPLTNTMGVVQTEPLRYLDNHRQIVTLGTTVLWDTGAGPQLRMDFFGQVHVLMEREHDIPSEVEGATENMVTSGWILAGGWGVSFEW